MKRGVENVLTYERYAEIRDAKGLSDHKVSLLTGIPRATFSAWRNGGYVPKLEKQLKIAKVLKLSPREIVSKADIKNAQLVISDG